jgi:hypothetical protein
MVIVDATIVNIARPSVGRSAAASAACNGWSMPTRRIRGWGAVAGIGAASGPVLGGILVGLISWRAVFVVNLPLGVLGLVLTARYLPRRGEGLEGGLDPPGQLLGIAALTLLTLGLIEGGSAGWTSARTLVPLAAFVPAAILFVVTESRVREARARLLRPANRARAAPRGQLRGDRVGSVRPADRAHGT